MTVQRINTDPKDGWERRQGVWEGLGVAAPWRQAEIALRENYAASERNKAISK